MPTNIAINEAKSAATALRRHLSSLTIHLSHSQALEAVANQLGYPDWNTAVAALRDHTDAGTGSPIPVLRVQDETTARAFYCDYLKFNVEWEHRFEPGMPLYTRIRRDATTLDLSEHHGDGTPGSVTWIPVSDIRSLHRELSRRGHPRLRPGIERDSPGGPTMEVIDPFGNILRFCQPST